MRDTLRGLSDRGFALVDLLVAMVVMVIVMTSLTLVMYSSLIDVADSRQRSTALALANQAVEEVRALPTTAIDTGMLGTQDPTWTQDPNVASNCFEQSPLDVNGASAASHCGPSTWVTPTCSSVSGSAPSASSLQSPAPLSPHVACYTVGSRTFGVSVYLTGNPAVLPLTVWAVVWWTHPYRGGLQDHVVISTSLSNCLVVGSSCVAMS